jgi:hypothetical protein
MAGERHRGSQKAPVDCRGRGNAGEGDLSVTAVDACAQRQQIRNAKNPSPHPQDHCGLRPRVTECGRRTLRNQEDPSRGMFGAP